MATPFDRMQDSIQKAKSDFDDGQFSPHNEMDFTGYVFHTWLSRYPDDGNLLHLEARVRGYKEPRGHADMAFGQARENPKKRLWIEAPEIIVESKSFRGFTPDQKTSRRKRLKNDIKALGRTNLSQRAYRVMIVLDDKVKPLQREYINEINQLAKNQRNQVNLFVVD